MHKKLIEIYLFLRFFYQVKPCIKNKYFVVKIESLYIQARLQLTLDNFYCLLNIFLRIICQNQCIQILLLNAVITLELFNNFHRILFLLLIYNTTSTISHETENLLWTLLLLFYTQALTLFFLNTLDFIPQSLLLVFLLALIFAVLVLFDKRCQWEQLDLFAVSA